ncbi:MAG: RND transporter, partial [Lysobacterales bacterium 13-68-4]
MKHVFRAARPIAVAALSLALAACVMPPRRLDPPTLGDNVPLAGLDVPERADWPSPEWWKAYHDDQLDRLIGEAMSKAPDLEVARSRVGSAEQSVRAAAAQAGLSIDGSAQISRQRMSEHGLIPARFLGFTWYNQADIGVQLQYDFDWWGKTRAAVESAVDQAHAAEAQRSAAAIALQYAVADTYFGWQADQARLALARQQLLVQERLSRIAQLRVKQGVDLPDDASRAQAQLAAAREMLVAIDRSGQIRLAALASLVGIAPDQLPKLQPRPLPDVSGGLPT